MCARATPAPSWSNFTANQFDGILGDARASAKDHGRSDDRYSHPITTSRDQRPDDIRPSDHKPRFVDEVALADVQAVFQDMRDHVGRA
jgi:hypothetical protein